jgi:transposase
LFAAFDVASGRVIGSLHRRHRALEFRKFLVKLDTEVPADLAVHLICDNLSTHKTPAITTRLAAYPRFHLHFTPTGSSWLNQVERWFGLLTDKQLRRGAHRSVHALEKDIVRGSRPGTRTRVLHVDQDRRRDIRTTQHISSTNSRRRTLGSFLSSALALRFPPTSPALFLVGSARPELVRRGTLHLAF